VGNQNLTTVTLPSTLTRIGVRAFQDCRALTAIAIPAAVTVIEDAAFLNANALVVTFVGVPTLETIGAQAFQTQLAGGAMSTFPIPASVRTIGNNAFTNRALTSIVIPATVETWGSGVFEGTAITSEADVTFPVGITHIPARMFANTALVSMNLPASVTTIGNGVFAFSPPPGSRPQIANSGGIQSFTFPPLVTEIPNSLFSGVSSLRSITIPNTITRIGSNAFANSGLRELTIPSSVEHIGSEAFRGSTALSSITLNEGLDTIGNRAFMGMTALRAINIPSSVKYFEAGPGAFDGVFMNSPITSPIVIPRGVRVIGNNTFRNTRIPSVVISDSTTSIGANAFSFNSALTSVEMGSGIETIGAFAFSGSTANLGVVTIKAPIPPITTGSAEEGADTLSASVFGGPTIPENIILLVADNEAVEAYEAAPIWQNFMLITTSISEGIAALRKEIADLAEELEYLEGSVDFFFEMVAELLGIEVEDLENFMDVEDAIEALLEEIETLEAQLNECLANQPLSVQGLSNTMLLEVSPNPVTNQVHITNEWAPGDIVEIFNSRGQIVFSQQGGTPGTASELVINMASFQAGHYIVRVGNRIAKVVKL
jgi:hypothetical protein